MLGLAVLLVSCSITRVKWRIKWSKSLEKSKEAYMSAPIAVEKKRQPNIIILLADDLSSTFNLRGFVDINRNRKALKFKPKQIPGYPLAIYVAGARFGTQFDLGPLNFDFNYTISINSFTKTEFRTNAHVFKFFLGWLF